MLATRAAQLIATFWVGSIWTIGCLVAPVLFSTLERGLAGSIAGSLFRIEAWLTLACSLVLLALFRVSGTDAKRVKQLSWIVLGMLLCTALGYFALHPFMAELRAAAGPNGMEGEARARFGMLHGVSSAFYLAQSLLGVLLILRLR